MMKEGELRGKVTTFKGQEGQLDIQQLFVTLLAVFDRMYRAKCRELTNKIQFYLFKKPEQVYYVLVPYYF